MTQPITGTILVPGSPPIIGLSFRHFRGEVDYPDILAVRTASREADRIERVDTLEDVARDFTILINCDPSFDVLMAEIDDTVIGYCRVWWWDIVEGDRIYHSEGYLLPEWRRQGIGRALLGWCEDRQRQIAAAHPPKQSRLSEIYLCDTQQGLIAMLESMGYQPVAHDASMVRPDLENIPEVPLPDGLEVRSALPEHYRQIWEASHDAFSDHWGYARAEWPFELFMEYAKNASLWRVAWDVDQIAGMVLSFIDKDENARFNRQRGYTENVAVRRPWRRRGLAKSLLVQSLHGLKEQGMAEAALGTHIENPHGTFEFYKSMGYQVVQTNTVYRKVMK
ncbi:MAG: GNAT family N-acetyltransferase [Anaerolineae bacterium]|nr:GNAT family N-acetyltransferase [Anaerolineae bacterium]